MYKEEAKDRIPERAPIELGYLSHDKKTTVHALMWEPDGVTKVMPKGIVQIVHGMAEHSRRYDEFACFLASQGFVVCANDHIGHGKSVSEKGEWGCLPAENGMDILIDDVHELRKMVASRFSSKTPYIMFGHSLGSMVCRMYVTRYGERLAAVALCGTTQQSPLFSRVGRVLAKRAATTKGDDYRSNFLHRMGAGAFLKGIEDPRTEFDWMSTDDAVIDAFIADESCGARFSAGGYVTVAELAGAVVRRENVEKVDKNLPVLFIAGKLDPVGDKGKGVEAAAASFRKAGVRTVDVLLYDGMRHEILNEPGHARVFNDVCAWIDNVLETSDVIR